MSLKISCTASWTGGSRSGAASNVSSRLVADFSAALHRLAEQRQKRGVLQQQHPPRVVIVADVEGIMQRIRRRHGVQRDNARLPHQQFPAPTNKASQIDCGETPRLMMSTDLGAGVLVGTFAKDGQEFRRGRVDRFALPSSRRAVRRPVRGFASTADRRSASPWNGLSSFVMLQRIGQRPQHRLGMLPADALPACGGCWRRRSPCGRCRGSRALRSGTTARRFRSCRAVRAKPGHGGIGGCFVPVVHRVDERLPRLVGMRHRRFLHRRHRPVAFAHVRRL